MKKIAGVLFLSIFLFFGCNVIPEESSSLVSSVSESADLVSSVSESTNLISSIPESADIVSSVSENSESTSDANQFPAEYFLDTAGYSLNQQEMSLIGGWQRGGTGVGAGRDAIYLFMPDGTFFYTGNTMMGAERLRYKEGQWSINDSVITITTTKKKVIEGGTEIAGEGSLINKIEGGKLVTYTLNPPEILQIPYDEAHICEDSSTDTMTLKIDDLKYYLIGLPPYYLDDIKSAYASDDEAP